MGMRELYLLVPLAPLFGAAIAGLFGRLIGRTAAHWITILLVAVSFFASVYIFLDVRAGHTFNGTIYTWLTMGSVRLEIGFLIDTLSALMMILVTFVSFTVHVYTIGYMRDDPSYQRFFSYISLFTFAMLMLVMSNNFLQLFFGWEAVGLVSYLLIGFWFTKPSAIYANLKAFLVNRVGDFGFILGITLILVHFGTLDYGTVFSSANSIIGLDSIFGTPLITVICLLLFIGAMGKSAQVPLHVWLPDSMEGPTPISALIHAATMVTAGIFMVARMSPLFELSETALSVVIVIGAITALSMALVALVQNDIKRVVAYSTLSQLGYMTVALGVSAYAAGMFHLMTHAFFKAVLFLGAGSVIVALHHEQDMRKMGGLRRYMPITYIAVLVGLLAGAGIPPFAGFFSKDVIIEAAQASHLAGSGFAYVAILSCVFFTALYSFRLLFMVFHGPCLVDEYARQRLRESPLVITLPLIALAILSICSGWIYIEPMVFGSYFQQSIFVVESHDVLGRLKENFHGAGAFVLHGLIGAPFWLALSGIVVAWALYVRYPQLPGKIAEKNLIAHSILEHKYYFDEAYDFVFARAARALGNGMWKFGDVKFIDGVMVNGTARLVGVASGFMRRMQTGFVYHYAFAMIIAITLFVLFGLRHVR